MTTVCEHPKHKASIDAGKPPARSISSIAAVAFLVVALAMVLVPSLGMIWFPTETTTENRELAQLPSITEEDGSPNWDILADAGAYFDDHFALRNNLVDANASLRAALGTSATDQVVIGADGWLYYGGTLPDYLGQADLSDRALRNIAHNLKLAQDYVQGHDAAFAFTVAPNKNTLYPQHMPYYYMKATHPGNAERLKPLLEEEGVSYVDLFGTFSSTPGEWYLKGDSHWDNRGALIATNELLSAVGHELVPLDPNEALPRDDFVGDLETMLRPIGYRTETNWYFAGYNDAAQSNASNEPSSAVDAAPVAQVDSVQDVDGGVSAGQVSGEHADANKPGNQRWRFVSGSSVTDGMFQTSSSYGSGSLVMFRDSFGNALAPFWAATYERAIFSKMVPYNLTSIVKANADTVVIERAERHLAYLAENPPIMPSPKTITPVSDEELLASSESVSASTVIDGPFLKVSGAIEGQSVDEDASIYIGILPSRGDAVFYEPFWTTVGSAEGQAMVANDFGYLVYLNADDAYVDDAEMYVVVKSEQATDCFAIDLSA